MRFVLATALAMAPVTAMAGTCNQGSADILALSNWSAVPQEAAPGMTSSFGTNVTVTLNSKYDKPIRMIDGVIWFDDVLGRNIGGIEIDPDTHVAPGKNVEQEYHMAGFERLTEAAKADIKARVCIKGLVSDDGTKQTFE